MGLGLANFNIVAFFFLQLFRYFLPNFRSSEFSETTPLPLTLSEIVRNSKTTPIYPYLPDVLSRQPLSCPTKFQLRIKIPAGSSKISPKYFW